MSNKAWCGLVMALAALVAGCEVDQQQEVATYRAVIDADAPRQVAPISDTEPLTLLQALQVANRDNERLGIEGENYLQAIIAKKRILAEFLPTVSFAPVFGARKRVGDEPEHLARHFDAPVEASYFDFNAIRSVADFKRAAETEEQRKFLLLNLKASLLLDVVRAFYLVLQSEQQVEVLRNSLAVQEERVREVEAQIQAGTGRPLDLAQARAQAASTRTQVVQAQGQVVNARTTLAFLIGAPEVRAPLADRFDVPADVLSLDEFKRRGLATRQDLAAATQAIAAARQGVDSAVAQHYPSITLDLDYFVYRESIPSASIYAAFIEARIPIFTGGRIHQDVRAAWSVFRQSKLYESLTRRQVLQDIDIAFQNLNTSGRRLHELETQVQAAKEAFDQAADLVRFGRATNLDRLVAQDALLAAQLEQTSETYNHRIEYANLLRAAGQLGLQLSPDVMPATRPATQPATAANG